MTAPRILTPEYSSQTGTVPGVPSASPLTADQLAVIRVAHERSTKIRRAATVATVDASIMAVFAAFCLLSAVFDPVTGLVLGAALVLVTVNSFRGAKGLRSYDLRAPRLLAWNQAFLAAAVIVYAAYALYSALHGSVETARQYKEITDIDPQMGHMLQDMSRMIAQIVYLGLIGGTIVAQGLTGYYYFSRERLLRAYLEQTPAWVIDLQRQQAAK